MRADTAYILVEGCKQFKLPHGERLRKQELMEEVKKDQMRLIPHIELDQAIIVPRSSAGEISSLTTTRPIRSAAIECSNRC